MIDPDVIVVGGGPAGTAASWPLVAKGIRVLMLDAGTTSTAAADQRPPLATLRRGGDDAWRHMLGDDLRGLRDVGNVSPKLRILAGDEFGEPYRALNRISPEGIDVMGALAAGGLSNVWGAVSPAFDDDDLRDWPLTAADLAPGYTAVADRIGLSGGDGNPRTEGAYPLQPALPLSEKAERLLRRYDRRHGRLDIHLARSVNAVLSADKNGRLTCNLDGGCMWGCPRGSIYNSASEFPALASHDCFTLVAGQLVERIEAAPAGFAVHALDRSGGKRNTFKAKTVLLAAGTVASTRIALDFLGRYDADVPLATTPALAMAFCDPRALGRPLPDKGFGLAQLSLKVGLGSASSEYAYGELYDGAMMSAPDLIRHMPLTHRGAMAVTRRLMPALMVGFVFFPSSYSRNIVRLERGNEAELARLSVRGGYAPELSSAVRHVQSRIAGDLRSLGLIYLPGSARLYPPGAESHFGGTLAMGKACNADCEVIGADNLFVVDGAALPNLPAKPLTFTIMANASRVGTAIAKRFGGR